MKGADCGAKKTRIANSCCGVVTAALQVFIGEITALQHGVLETERELREALFKKQRLVREFYAPQVQKKMRLPRNETEILGVFQVRLGLTSEFDVVRF